MRAPAPANDNPPSDRTVVFFRVRETASGRFVVERRIAEGDALRRRGSWHDIHTGRDRWAAEGLCARYGAAFLRRDPRAVVRLEGLPARLSSDLRSA